MISGCRQAGPLDRRKPARRSGKHKPITRRMEREDSHEPGESPVGMIFSLSDGHAHNALENRAVGFGGTMESTRDVATKYEVP